MAKPKYSSELKIEVAKAYLNGEGSYDSLAEKYGIGHKSVETWAAIFRSQGEKGFIREIGNKRYTSVFKRQCVEAVLSGAYSIDEAVAKYEISSRSLLRGWIKIYNANRELKDYDPKREVYMAEARRKTTIDERKEIVKYCIEHGRD
nr:transposase [Lachnospiraceae bacterium]